MTTTNVISRLQAAGLSRAEIAAGCAVTRAAVSHWASGRSIPKAPQLASLIRMAGQRGVVLLASDFGPAGEGGNG